MFSNKRVKEYYYLYQKLINFSNLSWWIIDVEDDPDIFYCNKAMCKTFSLDSSIVQHSAPLTCPIACHNVMGISGNTQKVYDEYDKIRKGTISEYNNCFIYYNSSTGENIHFSSRARVILKDECGKSILLAGIIEREVVSNELYKQAKTDGLTGLSNRREFDSQIDFLITLAKREKRYVSLIICDVDHFKQYNDQYGHYAGDECLIQIAHSISKACGRSSDIVCRYGGEEFGVIFYGGAREASSLAEAIRKEICALAIPHPAHNWPQVTLSIGYCTILPDSESTPKKLIECADRALYEAKRNGRNTCVQFKE